MQATATLTSKGQLTLPVAIRNAMGLTEGATFTVETRGNEIVLKPDLPMSAYRGILKGITFDIDPDVFFKEKDKEPI